MTDQGVGDTSTSAKPTRTGSAPDQLLIKRPVRQSLPQLVAQQLLDLIRSGALPTGGRLPGEAELKERFGVGRSTIREALNGLVLIGAVEVRHGQGAFVLGEGASPIASGRLEVTLRESVTRDLLEAREATELAIARYAAERASDEDLDQLRDFLDHAEARVTRDGAAVEEGARFHLLLAEAAQNAIFTQFIEMILGLLDERGHYLESSVGYAEWELEAHRVVLEAVASGIGDRAERAMARHLQDMRAILLEGWDVFRVRAGWTSSEDDSGRRPRERRAADRGRPSEAAST